MSRIMTYGSEWYFLASGIKFGSKDVVNMKDLFVDRLIVSKEVLIAAKTFTPNTGIYLLSPSSIHSSLWIRATSFDESSTTTYLPSKE